MYFETNGTANTSATVELALKTAKERSIKYIVVASNTGATARLLADSGLNVVCVTLAYGSHENGVNAMPDEVRDELTALGFRVNISETANDGEHEAGAVRSVTPPVGTAYPKGTQVFVAVWGNPDGTPLEEETLPE